MAIREINLLPPDRRRRLRRESVAVSLADIGQGINTGLLLVTLIGVAIIFSIWLFSVASTPTTKEELNQVVVRAQQLRDTVAEKNAVYERLADIGQTRVVWSNVLHDLLAATLPGVTVHQLSGKLGLEEGAVNSGTLSFSGGAITRGTLIKYEEQLRSLPWAREVTAPSSNLLERTSPTWQFGVVVEEK